MLDRIKSRVLVFIERATPKRLLPHVLSFLLPWVTRHRSGSRTRFHRVRPGLWFAIDPCLEGEVAVLAFYEESRASRYIYPGALEAILERRVASRYELGKLQVNPGDVLLDIGANIGEYAVVRSSIASTVIAVEGDSLAYSCLRLNARLHPNITPIQAVLSSEDGQVDFYESPEGADSSIVQPSSYARLVSRSSRSVDSLVDELGVQVDFMKCDVEGAEPEVLSGATRTLSAVRAVAVDAGRERAGSDTVEEVSTILEAAGLEVRVDGWMVHGWRRSA